MDKIEALKSYLESTGDPDDAGLEVTDAGWCLGVSDGREYVVLDGEGRRRRFEEDLRDQSAQYFVPSFLAAETGLPQVVFAKLCDGSFDANEAVVALIEARCGMDKLIDDAVAADGWGHFLSGYDGVEIELEGGYYAYRHN